LKTLNPNIEDKMPRIFVSRDERETCRKPRRGLEKKKALRASGHQGKRMQKAKHQPGARWCPSSLAKLVPITPISLWFMADITIVNGVYKPTYNWEAPSCGVVWE